MIGGSLTSVFDARHAFRYLGYVSGLAAIVHSIWFYTCLYGKALPLRADANDQPKLVDVAKNVNIAQLPVEQTFELDSIKAQANGGDSSSQLNGVMVPDSDLDSIELNDMALSETSHSS